MPNFDLKNKVDKKGRNKILFYGLPITAVIIVFVGLLYFILPTVNNYLKYRKVIVVLDENEKVVNKSINNLNAAKVQLPTLERYNNVLTEYVPTNPKLGDVINLIQEKAKDFNLESKIVLDKDASKTSINKLANKDTNKDLFESITSGEITFTPKDTNSDVNAVLLSMEINIKGNRDNFKSFLNEMKGVKPLINLVSINYSETASNKEVDTTIRFESYALTFKENIIPTVQSTPAQVGVNSTDNITPIKEEVFLIDKARYDKLLSLIPNDTKSTETKTTTTPKPVKQTVSQNTNKAAPISNATTTLKVYSSSAYNLYYPSNFSIQNTQNIENVSNQIYYSTVPYSGHASAYVMKLPVKTSAPDKEVCKILGPNESDYSPDTILEYQSINSSNIFGCKVKITVGDNITEIKFQWKQPSEESDVDVVFFDYNYISSNASTFTKAINSSSIK